MKEREKRDKERRAIVNQNRPRERVKFSTPRNPISDVFSGLVAVILGPILFLTTIVKFLDSINSFFSKIHDFTAKVPTTRSQVNNKKENKQKKERKEEKTFDIKEYKRQLVEEEKEKRREFICMNEDCGRISCLKCRQDVHSPSPCNQNLVQVANYGSTKEDFIRFVQEKVDSTFVRTCPQCGLNFIKSDGCNKMVCTNCPKIGKEPYMMCYICRKDIKEEKYNHFCRHFRPQGGKCTQCNKCDLFLGYDNDAKTAEVIMVAAQEFFLVHPSVDREKYLKKLGKAFPLLVFKTKK